MLKNQVKIYLISLTSIVILLAICLASASPIEKVGDYDDYEQTFEQNHVNEDDEKLADLKTIALNRDWLARSEPNNKPFYGFFSAWVATLIIVAGVFLLIALITGFLHLFGCNGKRPDVEDRPSVSSRSASLSESAIDLNLSKQTLSVNNNSNKNNQKQQQQHQALLNNKNKFKTNKKKKNTNNSSTTEIEDSEVLVK